MAWNKLFRSRTKTLRRPYRNYKKFYKKGRRHRSMVCLSGTKNSYIKWVKTIRYLGNHRQCFDFEKNRYKFIQLKGYHLYDGNKIY